MTLNELRQRAAAVAAEMKSGSLSADLRQQFIDVRAELFQRGIFDPVLVRFDSATVPKASQEEIAQQLEMVASAL